MRALCVGLVGAARSNSANLLEGPADERAPLRLTRVVGFARLRRCVMARGREGRKGQHLWSGMGARATCVRLAGTWCRRSGLN